MKLNRVMILTGENAHRHLLPLLLECMGYSCRKTFKADDALKQLRLYPADVIILDDHPPEIDGLSLLEKFSSQKNIGEPTIVILKSDPIYGFEAKALQCGAHAVINNSCSLQNLITAITPRITKK